MSLSALADFSWWNWLMVVVVAAAMGRLVYWVWTLDFGLGAEANEGPDDGPGEPPDETPPTGELPSLDLWLEEVLRDHEDSLDRELRELLERESAHV